MRLELVPKADRKPTKICKFESWDAKSRTMGPCGKQGIAKVGNRFACKECLLYAASVTGSTLIYVGSDLVPLKEALSDE